MRASSFSNLMASLLLFACSGESKPPDVRHDEDAPIAPKTLDVAPHASGCGKLSLSALTLRQGPSNAELYAALKNDGDTPACSPAFSVNLLDASEQSLAMEVGGLLVRSFYHLVDGSNTVAACVGPGEVTMLAITDLPADVRLDDVSRVEYWCNFWALEVTPIAGLSISQVEVVTSGAGVSYTGTLVNDFDLAVAAPSVAVFPINGAGRPLAVALGQGNTELPPGGSWSFETNLVSEPGVAYAAYPAGGLQ